MAYLLVAYVSTQTFVTLVTATTVTGIVVIVATNVKRLAYNNWIRVNFKSGG